MLKPLPLLLVGETTVSQSQKVGIWSSMDVGGEEQSEKRAAFSLVGTSLP